MRRFLSTDRLTFAHLRVGRRSKTYNEYYMKWTLKITLGRNNDTWRMAWNLLLAITHNKRTSDQSVLFFIKTRWRGRLLLPSKGGQQTGNGVGGPLRTWRDTPIPLRVCCRLSVLQLCWCLWTEHTSFYLVCADYRNETFWKSVKKILTIRFCDLYWLWILLTSNRR